MQKKDLGSTTGQSYFCTHLHILSTFSITFSTKAKKESEKQAKARPGFLNSENRGDFFV